MSGAEPLLPLCVHGVDMDSFTFYLLIIAFTSSLVVQPRYCERIADFGHEIVYLDCTGNRFVWNVDGLESDCTAPHKRSSIVLAFFSLENSKSEQYCYIGIAPEGVTTTPNFMKIGGLPASVQTGAETTQVRALWFRLLHPISFIS